MIDRTKFERHCGVYDGVIFSEESEKYIPEYFGEGAYMNCIRQNALFAGWKAHVCYLERARQLLADED